MDRAARRFLRAELGLRIEENASLARFSSIKVGGPAQALVAVNETRVLTRLLAWAHQERQPFFLLGGGTNTLFADAGVAGLTIYNRCRAHAVRRAGAHAVLEGDSGALLAQSARLSMQQGLTGLEWAVSVPGTLGGAVVGNAGAHGSDAAACLDQVETFGSDARRAWRAAATLRLAYRESCLKPRAPIRAGYPTVVTQVRFRLRPGAQADIDARAQRYLRRRRRAQPTAPSLGSVFRNPPGHFAGALIEAAGCKGWACGAIAVSRQHANFLVCQGAEPAGRAADVVALMQRIRVRVQEHCGIRLQPEICLAGDWPEEALFA